MFEKLKLNPGLLTLRYTVPPSGVADAVIRPFVPPGSRNAITLMFEPGNMAGALVKPGQLCVISCSRTAVLGLEIVARDGGEKPNGSMEIDYLMQADELPAEPVGAADFVACFDGFGDRPARFGDWVEGDAREHAISGLMIRPRALASRIMMRDPGSDQIVAPGEYLGSRKGFRPLSELQLWLDEPDGRNRLHVQADFAAAGRVESRGTLVTLHGAGPQDQLLRLNIAIEPVQQAEGGATTAAESGALAARPERVKIFRKG